MNSLPILFYLVGVFIVGLAYSSRRDRTAEDYFYGGKTAGSLVFGSSLVLSNILRYQVILLPLAALGSYWPAVALSVVVVILSYRLRMSETEGHSDFLSVCNGRGSRMVVSALVLLFSVTVQIGALLVLANYLLHGALGLDFTTTALLIIVFAGIYSIVGGFAAVAHTQTLQMAVVVVGLIVLAAMRAVPSPAAIFPQFGGPGDFSVTGVLLGLPVISLWIWHYDRLTLRESRAPKNEVTRRTGLLMAGVIAVLLAAVVSLPGSDEGTVAAGAAHQLMLLVSFALLMASFAAVFAGSAELVSREFFGAIKPSASEQEVVLIGRLVTAAVAGLTIIMMPVVESNGERILGLFLLVQAALFPPVTALYAAKLLFRSAPSAGVLPALIAGEVLGILRIVLHGTDPAAINPIVSWFVSMDLFLFAFVLFGVSLLVLYGAGVLSGLRLRAADRLT